MKRLDFRALFLACALVLFFQFSSQKSAYFERDFDERHAYFLANPLAFLDVSPVAIKKVLDAMHCALECLANGRCFSFNMKVKADADRMFDCQLLASDKYNSSGQLKHSPEFNHHSIVSPCEASPCLNGGICRPVYERQTYECVCAEGFEGANCHEASSAAGGILPRSLILDGHPEYSTKLETYLQPVQTSDPWKLCFRASENSYSASAFHAACDNKGPTVTLVRVGHHVFGGYTDKSWGGDGGKTSHAAFLFSLKNNLDKQFKLPIVKNHGTSTESRPNKGPKFNNDIDLADSCNTNTNSQAYLGGAYTIPEGFSEGSPEAKTLLAGTERFQCGEYEVFYQ